MRRPNQPRWDSGGRGVEDHWLKPSGLVEYRDAAAKILISSGELEIDEARGIVDRLAIRYLKRLRIATKAPKFKDVRDNITKINKLIEQLIHKIENLDEISNAVILGSKIGILLNAEDSELKNINHIVNNSRVNDIFNIHDSTQFPNIWSNEMSSLRQYLALVLNHIKNNENYSDLGKYGGPYHNKIISPEFKLVCEGCAEFEIYQGPISTTIDSQASDFLCYIKKYAIKDQLTDSDWVHHNILKYHRVNSLIFEYENTIKTLKCELDQHGDDEKLWDLCGAESDLDRLEAILEDDLDEDLI